MVGVTAATAANAMAEAAGKSSHTARGRSRTGGGVDPGMFPEYSSSPPMDAIAAAAACARVASSARALASAHARATVGAATSAKTSIIFLASAAVSAPPGVSPAPSASVLVPVATTAW